MDHIFPRLRDSSPKKVGINSVLSASVWVYLTQISAIVFLAITPLLIVKSLQQFGEFVVLQLIPSTNLLRQTSQLISPDQLMITSVLSYCIAWIYLGCSLWVYYYRRYESYTPFLVISQSAFAICLATMSAIFVNRFMIWLWILSLTLASCLLIIFVLRFPQELKRLNKHFHNAWIGYGSAIIFLSLIALPGIAGSGNNITSFSITTTL
jgi:hypothetical protein